MTPVARCATSRSESPICGRDSVSARSGRAGHHISRPGAGPLFCATDDKKDDSYVKQSTVFATVFCLRAARFFPAARDNSLPDGVPRMPVAPPGALNTCPAATVVRLPAAALSWFPRPGTGNPLRATACPSGSCFLLFLHQPGKFQSAKTGFLAEGIWPRAQTTA